MKSSQNQGHSKNVFGWLLDSISLLFSLISSKMKVLFLLLVILMVCVLKGYIPVMFKHTVDEIAPLVDSEHLSLGRHLITYMVLFCFLYLLEPFKIYLSQTVMTIAENNLLRRFVNKLNSSDYLDVSKEKTGKYTHFLERGQVALKRTVEGLFLKLIPHALDLAVIFTFLALNLGARYSILFLFFIAGYIFVTYGMQRRLLSPLQVVRKSRTSLMTSLSDYLRFQQLIRIFNKGKKESLSLQQKISKREADELSLVKRSINLFSIQNLIFLLAFLSLFILAQHDIQSGTITLGDLVMIQTYLFNIFAPVRNLGSLFEELIKNSADLLNVKPYIKGAEHNANLNNSKDIPIKRRQLQVKNLSFELGGKRILDHISLEISNRRITAIVGRNGSGKSTLIKLILNLYQPTSGKVLIDDLCLSDLSSNRDLNLFSIAPQEQYILSESIRNNITFSANYVDEERLIETCKRLDIHDWIVSLNEGYDTIIGEGGVILSGGEQQLICIARALYIDTQFLILDEATSQLNSRKEADIMWRLENLFEKTIILITHNPSLLVNASKIYVLEEGRIVQEGIHSDLLKTQGAYHDLFIEHDNKAFEISALNV